MATRLARFAYLTLSYLMAPLVLGFIVWRGFSNRSYWERLGERFGFSRVVCEQPSIWIHAVSVGEVQAAASMVRALANRYQDVPLVVTTTTPTGAQRVKELFGDRVLHVYVPYDLPGSVRRFFRTIRPMLAVVIETELWPNLYHECGRRKVPLVLASARISPRSVHKYRRFAVLFREALSHGIVIAAQSDADAERFRQLGAAPERTHVTGNIKFDFEFPPEQRDGGAVFRKRFCANRPVWVAASTHEGEEEQVLRAHEQIRRQLPDCLLFLVPRHPERFETVEALLEQRGVATVTRRSGQDCTAQTEVFLVDTLGELPLFYAASDVAFVGGSLVPVGGHNMLEPAALGLPVLTGPHNFNAQDVAEKLFAANAAYQVEDAGSLARSVKRLLTEHDLRASVGQRALETLRANRGALDQILGLIQPFIGSPEPPRPPPATD